jgi:predicted NBD/HSP70 family sugar kinase
VRKEYFIGIDIGKTNVRVAIAKEEPRLLYYEKRPWECLNYDEMSSLTLKLVEEAITETGIPVDSVCAIGIGVPAVVNRATGKVLYGPGFDIMDGYSCTSFLAEKYGVPVFADTDTVVGTRGELWGGIGQKCDDFAIITWGSGIGAGRVKNGKIVLGRNNLFPEFGHSIVSDDDFLCACGSRGCIETVASGHGIARLGQLALERGENTLIGELSDNDPNAVTSEIIFDAAARNDATALQIVKRLGILLGRLCVNLVYMDQPKKIVVIGGLVDQKKWVLPQIVETMSENCWLIKKGFVDCEVLFSELGDTAGALGAIHMARDYCESVKNK